MKKIILILIVIAFMTQVEAGTKQIIISRSLGAFTDANTQFMPIMGAPDYSEGSIIDNAEAVFPTSGTIGNYYVELTVAPADCGGCPVNPSRRNFLYKNGVKTDKGCNVKGFKLGCTDNDDNLAIAKGDRIAFGSEPDFGNTSASEIMISFTFHPDNDNETVLLGGYGEIAGNPATNYIPLHGRKNPETSAPDVSTLILGNFDINELVVFRRNTPSTGTIDFNVEIDGTLYDGCRLEASDQQCTKTFNPTIYVTDWNEVVVKETSSASQTGNPFVSISMTSRDNNNFLIATSTDTTMPTCSGFPTCTTPDHYHYTSAADNPLFNTDAIGRQEHIAAFRSTEFTLDKFAVSLDGTPRLGNDWNFMVRQNTDTSVYCEMPHPDFECSSDQDLEFSNDNIILQIIFHRTGFGLPTVNGLRSTVLFKPTPVVDVCVGVCDYTGGDYIIPCGCACDLNESLDLGGNLFWIDDTLGGGITTISKDINNIGNFTVTTNGSFCTVKGTQHLKVKRGE